MTESSRNGLYYGWIIAVTSGVILLITNGMTLAGLNVYDKPLLAALEQATGAPVPLAEFKFRDAITLFVSGLLAPFAGAAADRFGVRPLMLIGAVVLAVGYFLYSMADSLTDIYGIHVLFASALATCGLVVNVILVSRWFVRHRGLALGITLAGTSLGNGSLPPLNAALMQAYGYQTAIVINSALPLLIIPLVLFVIRERPADMGLRPPTFATGGPSGDPAEGMAVREAFRTLNFWILSLIAMFTFFSIIGTQAHLNLYLLGEGYSQMDAGLSYAVLFYLGLVGKVASGFLADRFGRKPVFVTTLALMTAGAGLLASGGGAIWTGLVLFGAGWGGLYTLLQLLAADYFGPRDLGKILGFITVLDTFGGGFGPSVIGAFRDRLGSYDLAFMVVATLVGIALLLATQFRLSASRPAT